jgi:hypothetical protein
MGGERAREVAASSLTGTVLVAARPALVSTTWVMDAAFAPFAAALILGSLWLLVTRSAG